MKYWFWVVLVIFCITELYSIPSAFQFHTGIGVGKYGSEKHGVGTNLNLGIHLKSYYAGFKISRVDCDYGETQAEIIDLGLLIGHVTQTNDNTYLTIAGGISRVEINNIRNEKDGFVLGLPWLIQANVPFIKSSLSTLGLSFTITGNVNNRSSFVNLLFGFSFLAEANLQKHSENPIRD